MSTPEQVAAQPDWDAKARAIITACVGERAAIGHVAWRKAIADALREAEQRGTASQRATIERLERERDELRELEIKVQQLQIGAISVSRTGAAGLPLYEAALKSVLAFQRAALSTTGATTGEDRGGR